MFDFFKRPRIRLSFVEISTPVFFFFYSIQVLSVYWRFMAYLSFNGRFSRVVIDYVRSHGISANTNKTFPARLVFLSD